MKKLAEHIKQIKVDIPFLNNILEIMVGEPMESPKNQNVN